MSLATIAAGLIALSLSRRPGDASGELSVLMEPDGTGVWRGLISEFNRQNPGPPVRLVEGPPSTNAREDMYSTSFLSGQEGYDIVYFDVIWTPKFAAAGWLLDLTPHVTSGDREDFLPADLKASSYNGKLYRWPAFADVGLLYYRRDLAGNPPETFDGLLEKAQRLRAADMWGFLWQGRQYEGLVTVFLEVLWGMGGEWLDVDRQKVQLDKPEAVQAVEFLKGTIGTVSPPGVTTYVEEDTRALFQGGRSVFLRSWPYVWTLLQRSKTPFANDVGLAPMVHGPGHESAGVLGGWGFSISKFSRNPDRALAFVRFITANEQLEIVHKSMGRIPSRKSLIPPEFTQVFLHARMRPPIPQYAQASDVLQRGVSRALTGQQPPETAMAEAARETRALLGWSGVK